MSHSIHLLANIHLNLNDFHGQWPSRLGSLPSMGEGPLTHLIIPIGAADSASPIETWKFVDRFSQGFSSPAATCGKDMRRDASPRLARFAEKYGIKFHLAQSFGHEAVDAFNMGAPACEVACAILEPGSFFSFIQEFGAELARDVQEGIMEAGSAAHPGLRLDPDPMGMAGAVRFRSYFDFARPSADSIMRMASTLCDAEQIKRHAQPASASAPPRRKSL